MGNNISKNKNQDLSNLEIGLAYDDVLIVPSRSSIKYRQDISLTTKVSNSISLEIPIMAAPMDSVCEAEMAIALGKLGGLGVIHRFQPPEEQANEVEKVKKAKTENSKTLLAAFAIGIEHDMEERTKLCVDAGADILVLDIAHAHSDYAISAIEQLRREYSSLCIVAGSIATVEAAIDFVKAGADCLRIGVGPGGVCTTRVVAGIGFPQLSAVSNIVSAELGIPVIADGGIRTSGDIAKALAVGADTVMLGSLLAGTAESPGTPEETEQGLVKFHRGMASKEAAQNRAGRHGQDLDEEYFKHHSPQGVECAVEYKGSAEKVVQELVGGVKSSLSYVGASNLEEFRQNAKFIQVTSAGLLEGKPHASF